MLDFEIPKKQFLPIRQWEPDERPREKVLAGRIDEMPDEELLAILIGSGTDKYSAVDVGRRMLDYFGGNLMELSRRSPKELARKFSGIGEARAVTILSGIELGRRSLTPPCAEDISITSSQAAFRVLCRDLSATPYERFVMLLLAQNGRLVRKVLVSEGGMASTTVDAKKIFKYAIDELCCGLILAHNHPSGSIRPSREDIEITERLVEGARLLDLHIFDHLIICGQSFFSFADNNLVLPLRPESPLKRKPEARLQSESGPR